MNESVAGILEEKGGAVWFVTPETSVYDAIALMAEKAVGAILVLSASELIGIVTERDYARKVILQGRSSKDTPVSEIMTSSLVTVTPQHSIEECMRIITHHRIRHLPVLDGNRLAGVVSIGDLVNAIISDQEHTINQLHTYITGKYPA